MFAVWLQLQPIRAFKSAQKSRSGGDAANLHLMIIIKMPKRLIRHIISWETSHLMSSPVYSWLPRLSPWVCLSVCALKALYPPGGGLSEPTKSPHFCITAPHYASALLILLANCDMQYLVSSTRNISPSPQLYTCHIHCKAYVPPLLSLVHFSSLSRWLYTRRLII